MRHYFLPAGCIFLESLTRRCCVMPASETEAHDPITEAPVDLKWVARSDRRAARHISNKPYQRWLTSEGGVSYAAHVREAGLEADRGQTGLLSPSRHWGPPQAFFTPVNRPTPLTAGPLKAALKGSDHYQPSDIRPQSEDHVR